MSQAVKDKGNFPGKTVRVSVPGKIHLMGEHAVVYGKPALLAAIDMRLTAEVAIVSGKKDEIAIDAAEDSAFIRHVFDLVCREYKIKPVPPVFIRVKSELPVGYHLGSSAAVAAAVIGALSFALKRVWNPTLINNLAYEAEKIKHGTPSGGDNTAVIFGGFLWYRKELEFLRTLWQLPIRLSPELINGFVLIDTGRPEESTGEMVASVKLKAKSRKSKYDRLFSENEQATRLMAISLKEGNLQGILEAIRTGEKTLEQMGVVSRLARNTIKQIESLGGAAKILGGGGKRRGVGYLLAFHPENDRLINHLSGQNYRFRKIKLGEEGIRLEKKD